MTYIDKRQYCEMENVYKILLTHMSGPDAVKEEVARCENGFQYMTAYYRRTGKPVEAVAAVFCKTYQLGGDKEACVRDMTAVLNGIKR